MTTGESVAVMLFAGTLIAAIAVGAWWLGSRQGRWK